MNKPILKIQISAALPAEVVGMMDTILRETGQKQYAYIEGLIRRDYSRRERAKERSKNGMNR